MSTATWKVIASDLPIGLIVRDGEKNFEAFANGDGPALGRELEIAQLLRFIRRHKIRNVVWVTADVHYAAAHRYDPERAQFKDLRSRSMNSSRARCMRPPAHRPSWTTRSDPKCVSMPCRRR